jgi:LAO/AO transport system kinase
MELADVVVVNKADGDNVRSAEKARGEAARALHLFPASRSGWTPRAMCCSALDGRGVADLWSCVLEHDKTTRASGWFERTRREQALCAMKDQIELKLLQIFRSNPRVQQRLPALERKVLAGNMTTASAVRELLSLFAAQSR